MTEERLIDRVATIADVCAALTREDLRGAEELVERRYPFEPPVERRRSITRLESTQVFLRDGFIDRYTGDRLVFSPVLRMISEALPAAFPFHPHGKLTESHIAHWELSPTVDHVVPLARGGTHDMDNWVTTSMLKNQVKSHWTLEELGWRLVPPSGLEEWDGLLQWFLEYIESHEGILNLAWARSWHRVATQAVGKR